MPGIAWQAAHPTKDVDSGSIMSGPEQGINEYFESVYRTQSPDGSVVEAAPWDVGAPQPMVIELERGGAIQGEVLDAGCGTGENALYLAARGYAVTGVDAAPSALAHARAKAAQRGLTVEFEVADARELTGYDGRFDTVVDSGLLHTFSDPDSARYVAALRRVCRPGGLVHVLAISDAAEYLPGPRRLSEQQMRAAFTGGWVIELLRPTTMHGPLPAWLLTARRT